MIAVDTNILVRFLVCDDQQQAEAARTLLESLTAEQPGFICREVTLELVWVLEQAYNFSRHRIASIVEELVSTEGLVFEAQDDVARSAIRYRTVSAGFSDLMISSAAKRAGAPLLYTFDKNAARLERVTLLATGTI